MWCADPYVQLLRRRGYCLVRLPREDLRPAQVLARMGKELQSIGGLGTTFISGGAPLPPVHADVRVAELQGNTTGRLGAGLGLSILGDIIRALGGGTVGLESAYQRARRLTFTFHEVLRDQLDLVLLDRFLALAELPPGSPSVKRMLDADELYVITATLKTRSLSVEALGAHDSTLEVDASAVRQVVGGQVGVSGAGTALSKVTYEGPVPLVFGFQAVQLLYQEGTFSALQSLGSGLSLEDEEEAPRAHGMLESDGPFLHLGG
jgi:hypothetical protein